MNIKEKSLTIDDSKVMYLPVEYLSRGKFQPRKDFEQDKLQELANSIREHGVIEPIIVREISKNRYEIIAGERRWRASQLAGVYEVPCLVKDYSDHHAAAITIIENIQRENLNPIEEAQSYQTLINAFNYSHDDIASQLGKSRAKVTNSLRLLKLDSRIQDLLRKGSLTEGHGKILAGLPLKLQCELAQQAIDKAWSVRKLEQVARKIQSGHSEKDSYSSHIKSMERALSDFLGSQAAIEDQGGKGYLKIRYENLDILEGIFDKIKFRSKDKRL